MSNLIEDLLALQSLVRIGETATLQQKTRIEELRARIPAPIAAHFFRQITNGRRGIALVRSGVCGECHLRLSRAMVAMLGRTNELLVCESCGAFVALAPEEKAMLAPAPRVRRVARTPVAVVS
jgi:predicted  nucleic acid-binding Zn-ribbon protein